MEKKDIVGAVDNAIQNRKETHNGLYSDIGLVLDKFSTEELTAYFIRKYGESSIRYFLEQQIISGEINRIRYA